MEPCQPVDSCHDAGVCDLQTGACSAPAKDDGVLCDDEDQCTVDDRCRAGACGGSPKTCPALDECHFDGVCAPSTFTPEDHRGTLRVALYRAQVNGDTSGGSVAELMKAGTMRLEPVTTIELDRKREWLGW